MVLIFKLINWCIYVQQRWTYNFNSQLPIGNLHLRINTRLLDDKTTYVGRQWDMNVLRSNADPDMANIPKEMLYASNLLNAGFRFLS